MTFLPCPFPRSVRNSCSRRGRSLRLSRSESEGGARQDSRDELVDVVAATREGLLDGGECGQVRVLFVVAHEVSERVCRDALRKARIVLNQRCEIFCIRE